MLDMNSIERHLNTSFIGRYMEYHESIASTNSRAKDLAHQKQEGTVIIAEEQTQGRAG